MTDKDLTHKTVGAALSEGAPLTHEQRGVLLGLVIDDEKWQRLHDELAEQLAGARHALQHDAALLRQALDALEYHRGQTRQIDRTAETISALRARLEG